MSLPYFRYYPKDFEAKAGWLSLAEEGAYHRLLRLCWMTPGCSIPSESTWIRRRLKVSEEDFEAIVKPILEEFFVIKKTRFLNPRLHAEYEEAKTKYSNKKNAANKARQAKSLKNNKNTNAKTGQITDLFSGGEPEPEPDNNTDVLLDVVNPPFSDSEIAKQIQSSYNDMAERAGLPKCLRLNQHRKSIILARYRETNSMDQIITVLERVENTPFLCGDNERGWRADLNFVFRESGYTSILEGKYENDPASTYSGAGKANSKSSTRNGSGTSDLLEAVGRITDRDQARRAEDAIDVTPRPGRSAGGVPLGYDGPFDGRR